VKYELAIDLSSAMAIAVLHDCKKIAKHLRGMAEHHEYGHG
jgi:hypothetical protein